MPTIHPVVDEGLGNSAYVVELGDGRALVVDPARDPTPYLELARWRRLRIAYGLETHLHADFLTGSRDLAAADGAQVLAPRTSRLGFSHRGLEDDEEVDLGGLTLRALATPGHAPEHVSYLLRDGERPQALFSGGALLVGTVARTDLAGPELTEPLARAAYRSLHQRLLPLPDELGVYPTHGAGSFCSAPVGGERTTSIGAERRHNRLLAAPDEDTFVAELLASFGSYPPYFLRLRDRNRAGPELLGRDWRVLPLLSTDQVREHLAGGGVLIDARPVTAFATGHIPGALSIALRPQFASWLGWLVDDTQPLVVVLDDDQDRGELARQCRTIGYDHLTGELAGGMAAWQAAGLPQAQLPLVQAEHLDDHSGVVLDVRQASEVADGHLPGAVAVELGALAGDQLPAALPSGPVTVMCGHGERAMTAASLLARAGHTDLRVALGGPQDWQRATGQALARS
ncbi:MAG TPA: rhodanese-like domain-containing protein [Actinomycetes bacterium]|jgi:glyoxylase-like metal-dependent hydrolase (beta-lactamase superfamily II)/rhodanese-related sulfurtransferase|nr:rhodanese-like domain-containing protein [Actinomycetes bacterium]